MLVDADGSIPEDRNHDSRIYSIIENIVCFVFLASGFILFMKFNHWCYRYVIDFMFGGK